MKRLNELQSLVKLAQNFGQDPDPKVLDEIVYLEEQEAKKKTQQDKLKQRVKAASQALFESNPAKPKQTKTPIKEQPQTIQEPVVEQTLMDRVVKNISESTVVNPEPELVAKPTDPLARKVDLLEKWISRIAATGPGGGAGDVINLDYPVKTITVSSYTVLRRDHYLGINVGTSTTIILPLTGVKQGRNIIVKDESGHCSINPITITGTIDNDTSGATLAIDNGGLHFIYNNGWRIV